jgi:DNA-binding NarL/FixJ family response regulator
MTRVLIVDDHPVFRRGLAALITASGLDVVGEAASEREAVALAARLAPDVVLMDLGLPDGSGIAATAQITAASPRVRVVVVTMFDDDGTVREALQAGAAGYIVKDASYEEILATVHAVALGTVVLGSGVRGGQVHAHVLLGEPEADPYGFTPRERAVAELLAKGLPNRVIAERLGIAGKTVANNVSMILMKLSVADRIEAGRVLRG